ncbi:hypothetical protein KGD82_11285 [Nocardiopsis eucommiae]|uniref:TPM domain-containing protein n=1 Tax=Nocardiopsis eucommiae TaxID=2831970 RepID=A0A975QM03_9ACTN|nr:hypothetical protein KGD82_11285 [Nocardiopsis eucommiae]
MRSLRLLALTLGALSASVLLPGATALAESSVEGPRDVAEIDDLTRVVRVAEELARNPVHVSHLFPGQPDEEARNAMEAEVSGAFGGDVPLFVVMYAAPPTDETGGQPTLFLHALHEVSGADGVYVAVSTDGRSATAAFDSPVTPVLEESDLPDDLRPADIVSGIVPVLEESPRTHVEATPLTRDAGPDVEQRTHHITSRGDQAWPLAAPGLLVGTLIALLCLRWSDRHFSPAPDVDTGVWFPAASRGPRGRVRNRLARELRALRREFEATPPGHRGLPRAREAYDAAGLIASSPVSRSRHWSAGWSWRVTDAGRSSTPTRRSPLPAGTTPCTRPPRSGGTSTWAASGADGGCARSRGHVRDSQTGDVPPTRGAPRARVRRGRPLGRGRPERP